MNTPRVDLPDAPAIVDLVVRPFDPARDHAPLADLIGEANVADGTDWVPSPEELRADFAHTAEFDARRDVLLAEVDGVLVAAAEAAVRTRDGIGVHEIDGWVRPGWRRRGLGRALLHWTERRAVEVARTDGRTGPRALSAWPDEAQVGALALYEGEGYDVVRRGFLMLRDLGEPIPDLPLPDGLEIRPVRPADQRRIWDAEVEAFRDHWDAAERTDADFEHRLAGPDLDTGRWQVAWDGDEVAGSVITYVHHDENAALGISRGLLERISVRRPWRRRGLASALIARSLRDLRTLGLAEAALAVDAENVSGALRVYEAIGFRLARAAANYRKPFAVE